MKTCRKQIKTLAILVMAAVFFAPLSGLSANKELIVGSKEFTEQRILGNIMIVLLKSKGFNTVDKTGLGSTLVTRSALENEQIDCYMEYTGTALLYLLDYEEPITDPQACYETVKQEDLNRNDLVWLPYMNFNNTYCFLMRKDDAEKIGVKSLSDLSNVVKESPEKLSLALNAEFYDRPDGYKPLQEAYDLKFPSDNIEKMQSELIYQAVRDGQADVGLGFSTDGRIKGFNLLVLKDDKYFFPAYNPAPVVRKETSDKYPELYGIFEKLGKKLDTEAMTTLNYQVDIEHKDIEKAATDFLKKAGLLPFPGNIDGKGDVDLADAVLALKTAADVQETGAVFLQNDADGDDRIGVADAVFVLEVVGGIR